MILLYLAVAAAAIAVIALVMLGLVTWLSKKYSKKSSKTVKRQRMLGALCAASFVLAIIAYAGYSQPGWDLGSLFKTRYQPVEQYTKVLESGGADAAYEYLPIEIYASGDDYYFKNTKGDMFSYCGLANVEDGSKQYTTSYYSSSTALVSGKSNIKGVLSSSGIFSLDGYFKYSDYESSRRYYSGRTASGVTYCDVNYNSALYITEDGGLYTMGFNDTGQLGDNSQRSRPKPYRCMDDIRQADISQTHTVAVDKFDNLWVFGDNSYSQFGNQNAISSLEPVKVMSGIKEAQAGDYFTVILANNGDVYTVGKNDRGQLGIEGVQSSAQFEKILSEIEKIYVSGSSCGALAADGTLYVWGDNTANKLGVGGSVVSTPTVVRSDVYDFTIGEKSIGIITLGRDILVSSGAQSFSIRPKLLAKALSFNAQVPEQFIYKTTEQPDKEQIMP